MRAGKLVIPLGVLMALMVSLLTLTGILSDPALASGKSGEDKPWVGVTLPSRKVLLGCQQTGQIGEILVEEGERVRAGQPLFRLESQAQQLDCSRLELLAKSTNELDQARESNRYLQDEESRLGGLVDKGMASESERREITHKAKLAKVQVDLAVMRKATAKLSWLQAKALLDQRTINSPCSGMVAKLMRRPGEVVDRLEAVIEVITLSPLWIELDAPVEQESRFPLGTWLRVRRTSPSTGNEESSMRARVIHTSMEADPASHTFRVRLALENSKCTWKAGLKVWIDAEPKK